MRWVLVLDAAEPPAAGLFTHRWFKKLRSGGCDVAVACWPPLAAATSLPEHLRTVVTAAWQTRAPILWLPEDVPWQALAAARPDGLLLPHTLCTAAATAAATAAMPWHPTVLPATNPCAGHGDLAAAVLRLTTAPPRPPVWVPVASAAMDGMGPNTTQALPLPPSGRVLHAGSARGWVEGSEGDQPHRSRSGLAVVATIRNEGGLLGEWLQHYRAQGATHMYLVDNQSVDGAAVMLAAAAPPDVTVIWWPGESQQRAALTHVMENYVRPAGWEWAAVVDADEFWAPRTTDTTLAAILAALPASTLEARCSWTLFSHSGAQASLPPGSLRTTFQVAAPLCPRINGNSKAATRIGSGDLLPPWRAHGCTMAHRRGGDPRTQWIDDRTVLAHYRSLPWADFAPNKALSTSRPMPNADGGIRGAHLNGTWWGKYWRRDLPPPSARPLPLLADWAARSATAAPTMPALRSLLTPVPPAALPLLPPPPAAPGSAAAGAKRGRVAASAPPPAPPAPCVHYVKVAAGDTETPGPATRTAAEAAAWQWPPPLDGVQRPRDDTVATAAPRSWTTVAVKPCKGSAWGKLPLELPEGTALAVVHGVAPDTDVPLVARRPSTQWRFLATGPLPPPGHPFMEDGRVVWCVPPAPRLLLSAAAGPPPE